MCRGALFSWHQVVEIWPSQKWPKMRIPTDFWTPWILPIWKVGRTIYRSEILLFEPTHTPIIHSAHTNLYGTIRLACLHRLQHVWGLAEFFQWCGSENSPKNFLPLLVRPLSDQSPTKVRPMSDQCPTDSIHVDMLLGHSRLSWLVLIRPIHLISPNWEMLRAVCVVSVSHITGYVEPSGCHLSQSCEAYISFWVIRPKSDQSPTNVRPIPSMWNCY